MAGMDTPRAYGAGRALRHVARALTRLAGPTWPLAPIPPQAATGDAATTCALCGADHRCPMEWGELDEAHWWVRSRCGDCGTWTEVVISNRQAATLDVVLHRQLDHIRAAADRLDAERMAEQVQAFTDALRRDLILATDF